jgi:hypothetical protein
MAGRAAPVAGHGVAVIALLGPADSPIAAPNSGDARFAGDRTNEIGLDDALGTAAVAAHAIPVVTFFALVEAAVAATRTGVGLQTPLRNVGLGACIR